MSDVAPASERRTQGIVEVERNGFEPKFEENAVSGLEDNGRGSVWLMTTG